MKINSNCETLLFKNVTSTGDGFFFFVCSKSKTLCIYLFSPSSSSPRPLQNIMEFEKKYFTDHDTTNTILGFRDSFLVRKMHDSRKCKNFEQHSVPIQAMQAIAMRRCKQRTSKSFLNAFSSTYIYSNLIVYHLFYC